MTREDDLQTEDEILDRLARIEFSLSTPRREFLSTPDAARFMGLSKAQLDLWRSERTGGPAFSRVGRRVLYNVGDLRSFMAERRVAPLG